MVAFSSQYWQTENLSPSGRPLLGTGEYDVFIDNNIGIYQDTCKVKNCQSGRLYLTNKRIIYVKNLREIRGLILNLDGIDSLELYGGFLKSSPKIILHMKNRQSVDKNENQFQGFQDSKTLIWACPICSFNNEFLTSKKELKDFKFKLPPCKMCGVQSLYQDIAAEIKEKESSKGAVSDLISFYEPACPSCTFTNHPMMTKCEMCGSELPNSKPEERMELTTMETEDSFTKLEDSIIKLAIRSGREREIHTHLQMILSQTHDSTSSNSSIFQKTTLSTGIHGLAAKNYEQSTQVSSVLGQSVQDLDNLMYMAKDLTELSRKYQKVLSKCSDHEKQGLRAVKILNDSKNSVVKFDRIFSDILKRNTLVEHKIVGALENLKGGVSTQRTLSKLPYLYLEELSRLICDYLITNDILDKSQGVITLYEVFLLFNKSRRISLVSANEIYDAMAQMERLNLRLTLGKISDVISVPSHEDTNENKMVILTITKKGSGFTVSKLIAEFVSTHPGLTILQLQNSSFNMNYVILETILGILVADGSLVIDKTLKGTTYWPNLILKKQENRHIKGGGGAKKLNHISLAENITPILKYPEHDLSSQTFKELSGLFSDQS